jgi:hypothetical protein
VTEKQQSESAEAEAERAMPESSRPTPEDGVMSRPDADRLQAQVEAADDSGGVTKPGQN